MKKITFFSIILFATFACTNNSKKVNEDVTTENKVEEESKTAMLELGCYEYNSNGNNIRMEITEAGEVVKGSLSTAYTGKDSNKGIFVGKFYGDKLIATYTFQSEGKESSREIAFLFKDSQLTEGFGDVNEDGTKFIDPSAVVYSASMPLVKVDCTK